MNPIFVFFLFLFYIKHPAPNNKLSSPLVIYYSMPEWPLTGADPGFSNGGGGGRKDCVQSEHITNAKCESHTAGLQPRGPESFKMFSASISHAIWYQKIVNFFFGGGGVPAAPLPGSATYM